MEETKSRRGFQPLKSNAAKRRVYDMPQDTEKIAFFNIILKDKQWFLHFFVPCFQKK